MPESTSQAAAAPAPTITQGQTTAVAENAQAVQEQPQAQQQPAAEEPQPFWNNILLYAVIGMWLWWFLGRKKRRAAKDQEKKEQERRNSLQKGDKVVTIGRMHGTVVAYTDDTVTIKPDPRSDYTMTFERVAIAKVMPRQGEDEEAETAAK